MPHGATHGFDIDDRYLYGCATVLQTKPANHEVMILDYSDPQHPTLVSQVHIQGSTWMRPMRRRTRVDPTTRPTLVVITDEIIACPPGYGRIVDISDLANPQEIATLRIPHVTDNFDYATGKFQCPSNGEYIHHPWFDYRSPSLLYTAWIDQGLRAWDISNPFLPREIGYYLSPRYPGRFPNRQVREVYQDRDTGLIYMADANEAGITVLRWTGAIPPRPPLPAAVPGAR